MNNRRFPRLWERRVDSFSAGTSKATFKGSLIAGRADLLQVTWHPCVVNVLDRPIRSAPGLAIKQRDVKVLERVTPALGIPPIEHWIDTSPSIKLPLVASHVPSRGPRYCALFSARGLWLLGIVVDVAESDDCRPSQEGQGSLSWTLSC